MVMAARVVHAVAHFGVPADRILGVTFTNKAAAELAERVRHCLAVLPPARPRSPTTDEELPTVATYNSYAAQIVRDHALRIGREPGATLLTEAVQWQLAMRVASRAPGPFPHLDWTTPYVAELVVALAGELSDHLCTHDASGPRCGGPRCGCGAAEAAEVGEGHGRRRRSPATSCSRSSRLTTRRRRGWTSSTSATRSRLRVPSRAGLGRGGGDRAGALPVVVLDEYQDTGVAQRVLFSTLFGDGHADHRGR